MIIVLYFPMHIYMYYGILCFFVFYNEVYNIIYINENIKIKNVEIEG